MDAERLAKIRKAAENVGSELMVGSGKLFIELSIFELLDHIDQLQRDRNAIIDQCAEAIEPFTKEPYYDQYDGGYRDAARKCLKVILALKDTP